MKRFVPLGSPPRVLNYFTDGPACLVDRRDSTLMLLAEPKLEPDSMKLHHSFDALDDWMLLPARLALAD